METLTHNIVKKVNTNIFGLSSFRSKYAIECVDFLSKTECFLSKKESVRIRLAAFVNMPRRKGHNKAADMQQDNNIKMVKTVERGLGIGILQNP